MDKVPLLNNESMNNVNIHDHFKGEPNSMIDFSEKSQVADFYAGKSVFITGASGFVGKCLLEKLLRSCPSLEFAFILMRPKRGKGVSERIEALLKCELFDRIRSFENGKQLLGKIKAVEGDINQPLFGLSDRDIELLSSNVSVVVHSAASVKFLQPLKMIIETNANNLNHLLNLATKLPNLSSLIHVSTAYSNCDRKQIDEELYETRMEPEKLISMCEWMEPEMLEKITPILLGKHPNTYTLTKALGESLFAEKCKKLLPNLPVAIVRPPMVSATWCQPTRGWVDNYNAATGIFASVGSGAVKAIEMEPDCRIDLIPVDMLVSIICVGSHITNKAYLYQDHSKRNGNLDIYNAVSGPLNPLKNSDCIRLVVENSRIHPFRKRYSNFGCYLIPDKYLFIIYRIFLQATVILQQKN